MTRDKLTVGIEFHTAHCGLSDRRGWPDGAAPQTVVWQVLANTQYPNTGIVRTLASNTYVFLLERMTSIPVLVLGIGVVRSQSIGYWVLSLVSF